MFPVRNFYIEQMFVLERMQFHNYVDTQPVKRFEKAMRYDMKFWMLQVQKNDISLRRWSGSSAQGTLVSGHQGVCAIWS